MPGTAKEFRDSALRRLALAPNVAQLCRELGISRQLVVPVAGQRAAGAAEAGTGARTSACVRKMLQLRKALVKKTLEVDFFKDALRKSRLCARAKTALARRHLRSDSETDADAGGVGVERMCRLAEVSRAGFYRSFQQQPEERRWKCAPRFSRWCSRIGAVTATGGSAELRRRGHG